MLLSACRKNKSCAWMYGVTLGLALILLSVFGCGEQGGDRGGTTPNVSPQKIEVKVKVTGLTTSTASKQKSAPIPSQVASVRLEVRIPACDSPVVHSDLMNVAGSESMTFEMELDAGSTACFSAKAYSEAEGLGTLLYSGSTSGVNLSADRLSVEINLGFVGAVPPTVSTLPASEVTATSAVLQGEVTPNGFETAVLIEWGLDTQYGSRTPIRQVGAGSAPVSVRQLLNGLTPGTAYHYRLVATNSGNKVFGEDQQFTTLAQVGAEILFPELPPPSVTTGSATNLTERSAQLNGAVNPNGSPTQGYIEWGEDLHYGQTTELKDLGKGDESVLVSEILAGLSSDITYHFRLVAFNAGGLTVGADQTFTPSRSNSDGAVDKIIGTTGGSLAHPNGMTVTIAPNALEKETMATIAPVEGSEIAPLLPDTFTFLSGIRLGFDTQTLRTPARLEAPLPAPAPVAGRLIVAKVVEIAGERRLTMVDTASITNGTVHTNSPPFPGVLSGGEYLFLSTQPEATILGLHLSQPGGAKVANATVNLTLEQLPSGVPIEVAPAAAETLNKFVGITDSQGFAAIPDIPLGSRLTALVFQGGLLNQTPGIGTVDVAVPISSGLPPTSVVDVFLQTIIDRLTGGEPLPPRPEPCGSNIISVPPRIPDSFAESFLPGQPPRQLRILSTVPIEDVTDSTPLFQLSDISQWVIFGFEIHHTIYIAEKLTVAPVTNNDPVTGKGGGLVTPISAGESSIYVQTTFSCLTDQGVVSKTYSTLVPVVVAEGHLLIVSASGGGTGAIQSDPPGINCRTVCGQFFVPETPVTLTVIPDSDSFLDRWEGACTGTNPTCSVIMDREQTVTATFRKKPILSVITQGNGSGSVQSNPAGIQCPIECNHPFAPNSFVTLTAIPDPTSLFDHWEGACTGTNPVCGLNMISNLAVTAVFRRSALPSVRINPFGSKVEVVEQDAADPSGFKVIPAPEAITVTLLRHVFNACFDPRFLSNRTVVIPQGADSQTFDFTAGPDPECRGVPTFTKLTITNAVMGTAVSLDLSIIPPAQLSLTTRRP